MNEDLINKISSLNIEGSDKIKIQKDDLKITLSKPIILEDIIFRKTTHLYCDATVDTPFEICNNIVMIDWYAYKKAYTIMGLLLFKLLFSKHSYIELKINHPKSEIKQLFFYLNKEKFLGLEVDQKETYKSYKYYASKVDKYPFSDLEDEVLEFTLGCSKHLLEQFGFEKQADQIIVSLDISGLITLAELFLNIGNINNQQTEICIAGVKHNEVRFWLPNSFAFYTEDIDDLEF